jgi:dTDP-4-dehydrorhamnose 3,5-epimerase
MNEKLLADKQVDQMKEPLLIEGERHQDVRGTIFSVNGFSLKDVNRFYVLSNESPDTIRAWQGHKKETKCFYALEGSFIIAAVQLDDFEQPSHELKPLKFMMEAKEPKILIIPQGYANGIRALTKNNKLLIFSNLPLQESREDTFRFPSNLWFDWKV